MSSNDSLAKIRIESVNKPGFVRAISLWNPHATLMVLGEKLNETRSKPTNIRGRVYIHASLNRSWDWMLQEVEFFEALSRHGVLISDIKYGHILGSVFIHDCEPTESVLVSRRERAFGNYEHGRFCWLAEDFQKLDTPIPYKGGQGFFWVPESVVHA